MNTKKRLIYAMKELLEENAIENITIDMIVRKSDISKSTFYRYFKDKYVLMTEYYNYNVDNVLSTQGENFKETMEFLLLFLKDNRNYFVKLSNLDEPDNFYQIFYKSSLKNTKEKIRQNFNQSLNKKEDAQLCFFIAGCAHVCHDWIRTGMKESPHAISELLYECVPEGLRDKII